MALVNFKKGLLANLPATKTAGTFYITTDERAMYLDVDASTRIRLGDFQEFANVTALTANPNPSTTALYYVSDINCLAKWNGSEYIQINKDTGMTSVEVTGDGNAITAAVYDAAGRKLTLTKGATYMTAADVDGKISTAVGTLGSDAEGNAYANVKAYVDAKTSGIATDTALNELTDRVSTAESEIDALQTAIADGGSVANAIADAKKAGTDAAAAAATAQATANSKTTMAEVEAKDYATKTEAQGYANAKDAAISAAKAAADAAQADVDALETKVGTVPENKTVVRMIADAQAAATYDDSALAGRVSTIEGDYLKDADKTALQGNIDTVSGKVTTLIGSVEGDDGKSARTIASEEVAKIVAGADASYDTLKEISDWISSHKGDASAMNSAIIALEGIVDGIGGDGEKATVVAYVTDAIAALNIGDYAKAADLTALASRVTTAEGKITTLEGQVATINGDATTAGSIAKAAADALASAKAYTDEKDTAMDTRVDALEAASHTHSNKALLDTYTQTEENLADAVAKKHEHTNKTVLDGITAEKVSAWNSAESNAKSYTDELANGQVTTNKTNIESLQSGKANKATTLAGYGIGDAYTKDEVQGLLTWGTF